MTRAQKIRQNERFRMKYEKLFVSQIDKALKSQISSFTSDLKNHGLSYAQSRLNTTILNEQIGTVLLRLYSVAGVAKAKQVYGLLSKEPQKKGFGFNAEWTNNIKNYFSKHLFDYISNISNTTRKMIQTQINEMISQGQSIDWLANKVESSSMTAARARMIARTESNRAINYGAEQGAQSTGFVMQKEWVAVHDNRTRHSHYMLDGTKVGMNDEFKPGLSYPGDPNGDPGETINCRCHVEYSAQRDANGYLVPVRGRPIQRVRNRQRLREILNIVQQG